MFAEAQLTPSSNIANSNTQNKRSSTNGYYKPDRQQAVDYSSTDYKLGNVLQQKPVMPKTEINNSMYSKGENLTNTIIQRKIGFEFETKCLIKRKVPDKDGETCLPKDSVIKKSPLFKIVADDYDNEFSDVEFVTEPLENYENLEIVNNQMKDAWETLYTEYVNKKNEITCDRVDCNLSMKKKELSANPQVTFGTSLSNIKAIADAADTLNKEVMDEGDYNTRNKNLSKIKETKGSEFNGLVELIRSYLQYAQRDKAHFKYPKMITDSFLLSRTDFGSLYKLVNLAEPIPKSFKLQDWLACFKDFDLTQFVFPHLTGDYAGHPITDLIVGDWLTVLYKEKIDKISSFHKDDKESMSSMGVDQVYNFNKNKMEDVGVFELRGCQNAVHYLDKSPSWLDYMNYWFGVIEKTGYLSRTSSPPELTLDLSVPSLNQPIPQSSPLIPQTSKKCKCPCLLL